MSIFLSSSHLCFSVLTKSPFLEYDQTLSPNQQTLSTISYLPYHISATFVRTKMVFIEIILTIDYMLNVLT